VSRLSEPLEGWQGSLRVSCNGGEFTKDRNSFPAVFIDLQAPRIKKARPEHRAPSPFIRACFIRSSRNCSVCFGSRS
jgi:hypothetical protein